MVEKLSIGALLRVLRAMAEEETQLLDDILPKKQVLQVLDENTTARSKGTRGEKDERKTDGSEDAEGHACADEGREDGESGERVDNILSLFDLRSISDLVELEENGGGFVVRVCKHDGTSFDVSVASQTTVSTLQRKVKRAMIEKGLAPPNTNWFDCTPLLVLIFIFIFVLILILIFILILILIFSSPFLHQTGGQSGGRVAFDRRAATRWKRRRQGWRRCLGDQTGHTSCTGLSLIDATFQSRASTAHQSAFGSRRPTRGEKEDCGS